MGCHHLVVVRPAVAVAVLAQVGLVVVILVADAVHLEAVIPCAKKVCE